jgi:hypothetical protein
VQTLISSNPSRTSSLVSASPLTPEVAQAWRTMTLSNQPQRRARPVFVPNFAAHRPKTFADFIVLLCRERTSADARRVGLGEAQHIRDRARPDTRSCRRIPCDDIGGSHERIGAVIDVQHHALGAFEQDALAGLHLLVQQLPDRLGIGQDLSGRFPAGPPSASHRPVPAGRALRAAAGDGPAGVQSSCRARPGRQGLPHEWPGGRHGLHRPGRCRAWSYRSEQHPARLRGPHRYPCARAGSAQHCQRGSGSPAGTSTPCP